jgi:hypothetical protein
MTNPKYWRFLNQSTRTCHRRLSVGGFLFILFYFIFLAQRSRDVFNWKDLPQALQALQPSIDLDRPPEYKRLKRWEMDLPQHNLDLPFPEGRTGRYVLFKNQVVGLGWNNGLNEVYVEHSHQIFSF